MAKNLILLVFVAALIAVASSNVPEADNAQNARY